MNASTFVAYRHEKSHTQPRPSDGFVEAALLERETERIADTVRSGASLDSTRRCRRVALLPLAAPDELNLFRVKPGDTLVLDEF